MTLARLSLGLMLLASTASPTLAAGETALADALAPAAAPSSTPVVTSPDAAADLSAGWV